MEKGEENLVRFVFTMHRLGEPYRSLLRPKVVLRFVSKGSGYGCCVHRCAKMLSYWSEGLKGTKCKNTLKVSSTVCLICASILSKSLWHALDPNAKLAPYVGSVRVAFWELWVFSVGNAIAGCWEKIVP